MKNSSGKVLTVFLVVIAIVLICLTAISVFFFQKEIELRKAAETKIEALQMQEAKLNTDLQAAQKQIYLLEEKEKEADEKINGLLDELELEQGLRTELKIENQSLKESLDNEKAANAKMIADLETAQARLTELADGLAKKTSELSEIQKTKQALEMQIQNAAETGIMPAVTNDEIELKRIVIAQPGSKEGRILSVDAENEFIIVNLGLKDGVNEEALFSVYRDEKYLGDAKVTRVQPEMSAADFVPPLSGKKVQKNDRILMKK